MRTISNRVWPERWRRGARALSPARFPGTVALRSVGRRLAWTLKLLERLSTQPRTARPRAGAMVLAPAATRRLRLATVVKQFHSVTHTAADGRREWNSRHIPEVRQTRITGVGKVLRSTLAGTPVGAPRDRRKEKGDDAITPPGERHRAPAQLVRRVPPLVPAIALFRAQETAPPGKRSLGRPWLSPPGEPEEQPARELPERVTRKHRRVEARPYAPAAREIAIVPAAHPAAIPAIPAPAAPRDGPRAAPAGGGQGGRATPQGPEINVARITDEVLRQLDRRLLAARERMGRI